MSEQHSHKYYTGNDTIMPKTTGEDLIEKVKSTLFLKGRNSSEVVNDAMRDLALLSKPYNKVFSKKNDISPFEDAASLEFLAPKNDCGLFVFGSHSKKRPDNLVVVSVLSVELCALNLNDLKPDT